MCVSVSLREGTVLGQLEASFHSSAKWGLCQDYDPGHPCQVSRLLSCCTSALGQEGGALFCLTSSETNQTEESWLASRIKTLLCTHFWGGDEFLWIFSMRCWRRTLEGPISNSQGEIQHRGAQYQSQQDPRPKRDIQRGSLKTSSDCGMQGILQPA